jgi:hypothetical protein
MFGDNPLRGAIPGEFSSMFGVGCTVFNSCDRRRRRGGSPIHLLQVDLTTLPDGIMPAAGNASGLAILAAHLASDYKPRLTVKDAILYRRTGGA